MPEHPRIDELRRRVLADPASIAFAALAEEYRRIGHYDEAIETCRTGLLRHPAYLSARVTLGRALIEMGDYEAAREELQTVLRSAPENLAAIRGLAQIHERMGHSAEMDPHLQALADEPMPVPVARAPEPEPEPAPQTARQRESELDAEPPAAHEPAFAAASLDASPRTSDPLAEFRFDATPAELPPPDLDRLDEAPTVFDEAPTIEEAAAELLLTESAEDEDVAADAAGPDPDTLATLARLEQFLGTIRQARSHLSSRL